MQFSCDDAMYQGDYQINYKLINLTIIHLDEDALNLNLIKWLFA